MYTNERSIACPQLPVLREPPNPGNLARPPKLTTRDPARHHVLPPVHYRAAGAGAAALWLHGAAQPCGATQGGDTCLRAVPVQDLGPFPGTSAAAALDAGLTRKCPQSSPVLQTSYQYHLFPDCRELTDTISPTFWLCNPDILQATVRALAMPCAGLSPASACSSTMEHPCCWPSLRAWTRLRSNASCAARRCCSCTFAGYALPIPACAMA